MKYKALKNGLHVSLSGNRAYTKFRASLPDTQADERTQKVLTAASLWGEPRAAITDSVDVPQQPKALSEDRYVYKDFRALSQSFLANRGLDFSTPGVLEAAVPMLAGKTVYPNHDFADINNWLGVVSNSSWDATGDQSNGIPGINCQIKLDAYLNYRIACGVMMTPPAINAMSLTVVFEFDYSHPQMAMENRWKFFENLGEEIDGEIVRLIVTKIVEIWEASLVWCGEDRDAKGLDDDDQGEDPTQQDDESFSAADEPPPISNEEKKTVKLTAERKQSLGIEIDGDEVPDEQVFEAIDKLSKKAAEAVDSANIAELTKRAASGDALVAEKRNEVTRLAKLAELGAAEGDLDEVVTGQIEAADADGLIKLETYYRKRVGERFPAGGRSSLENGKEIDKAGGVDETKEQGPARKANLL